MKNKYLILWLCSFTLLIASAQSHATPGCAKLLADVRYSLKYVSPKTIKALSPLRNSRRHYRKLHSEMDAHIRNDAYLGATLMEREIAHLIDRLMNRKLRTRPTKQVIARFLLETGRAGTVYIAQRSPNSKVRAVVDPVIDFVALNEGVEADALYAAFAERISELKFALTDIVALSYAGSHLGYYMFDLTLKGELRYMGLRIRLDAGER